MKNGTIKKYFYNRGFGYITSDEGKDYFFHNSQLQQDMYEGDKVSFKVGTNEKGEHAINIKLEEKKITNPNILTPINTIKNIANNWKLEAKLETKFNYFYNYSEVNSIISGEKYYVIGRKGSGKSSVSEYILGQENFDSFSVKLSFKNFPFNELYHLENKSYTPPNQYITLWKYVIYTSVVKLMIKNKNIDNEIRSKLENIYTSNPINSLSRTIKQWTSAEFGANFMGTGGTFKLGRDIKKRDTNWLELVNALEDIIINHCDSHKYFIVFDELDEDYRGIDEKEHILYQYLLTSLFKSVQDIRYTFENLELNIRPIIFLRDDIYSLIKDADKNKWRDFKIEIEWTESKIKKMLAYRISKDAGLSETLEFNEAWSLIFSSPSIKTGDGKKHIHSFDFITRSTHLRPRDYISYIQNCANETIEKGNKKILSHTIKFVDRAFSNYLKDEIVDEIYPLVENIEEVLQVVSSMRKWNFSVNEFKRKWNNHFKNNEELVRDFDKVLEVLFKFSVLGNQPPKRMDILYFKYMQTNMNLNKSEKLVLHRGLFKALQIV